MTIDALTDRIRQKMSLAHGLQARVKFDCGDDGIIFADTTQSPPVLSNEDSEADVTFVCSAATLEKIMDGNQDPTMAFMMGKLKVKGSMGLAMKLNSILED